MNNLPEVTEIRRWSIQPGDRLIIRCGQRLTPAQAQEIREQVRVRLGLPDDFPLVVIGDDVTIEVAPIPMKKATS